MNVYRNYHRRKRCLVQSYFVSTISHDIRLKNLPLSSPTISIRQGLQMSRLTYLLTGCCHSPISGQQWSMCVIAPLNFFPPTVPLSYHYLKVKKIANFIGLKIGLELGWGPWLWLRIELASFLRLNSGTGGCTRMEISLGQMSIQIIDLWQYLSKTSSFIFSITQSNINRF